MGHVIQGSWQHWFEQVLPELEARAEARGEAHGEARGEARGALETRREDLRFLLAQRFGSLPPALIEHIEQCDDLNQLQASLSQVLTIHSLDELRL